MKMHWKWVATVVLMAVIYFVIFGSGSVLNELDFTISEVRSAEILDDWCIMSPAKVTMEEDIQILLDSINTSKRRGVLSKWQNSGHPLTARFHLKNGEAVDFTVFPFALNDDHKIDYEQGTMRLSKANSFFELESSMYFTCVELAAKYNPDKGNVTWLQTWIERGYVPVLPGDESGNSLTDEGSCANGDFPQKAGLPIEERMELSFSSGAGAWSTWLMLNSDGTFSGSFHDSDMGDSGEDYPNGTVYYCNFSGVFENVVQEDLFSYSMKMTKLNCEDSREGEAFIEDGVRYVHSYPYGMEGGEEFILYRPEKAVEGLNEDFLSWWPERYNWGEELPWTLERFGLYNVNTGEGFFS